MPSEAVGGAGDFRRMRDVFARFFAAEAGRGKNFGGIAKLERVEGATHSLHGGEVGFGEHFGHGVFLVLAYAVFAGDGAAGGDAEVEDLGRKGFGGVLLARDARVEEDERVEIAVAGMEDVGDADACGGAEAPDFAHNLGKSGAGYDPVLHNVVGRDAAHGGEGGFAAFPDEGALGVGLGYTDFGGGVGAADIVDVGHEGGDFCHGAVEFYEQERATVGVIGVDRGFGGLDGERVHHFDGGGEHARGNDAADGGTGFVGIGERGEEGLHAFGALDDAENHFCGDTESAFGTDENAEEIVTGGVESFSAQVD